MEQCLKFYGDASFLIFKGNEDPFYVVDLGRLVELYRDWACALPTVAPFYAVKCNEDPALLKTLAALGTGFDCASKVLGLLHTTHLLLHSSAHEPFLQF